jgi:hypothetical protein
MKAAEPAKVAEAVKPADAAKPAEAVKAEPAKLDKKPAAKVKKVKKAAKPAAAAVKPADQAGRGARRQVSRQVQPRQRGVFRDTGARPAGRSRPVRKIVSPKIFHDICHS